MLESGSWGHSVLQTPALVYLLFFLSLKSLTGVLKTTIIQVYQVFNFQQNIIFLIPIAV